MIPVGLHGLAPGADFPRRLVDGLIAAMADHPPEAMAQVTLILNAGRMLRAVRAAFAERGARLLPRLRLVSDIGNDPRAPLPAAIPALRRKLELAQLVAGLVAGQRDMAAGTSVPALADSLMALLAEMQMEGVNPATLAGLDVDRHAAHWQRSLGFLNLITPFFGPEAPLDAAARQARAVAWQIDRWRQAAPAGPIVIAGSTGSRGATRDLMVAVARLPNGTVVMPGFDFDLPGAVWDSFDTADLPAEDHPQYRHHSLLRALDLRPVQVGRWPGTAPVPERAALVSMALRPAPVTDQWLAEGPRLPDLVTATAGMTLIAAPDPRAEANALALILRRAVGEGQRAALVTPDRVLARRVTAALDRWGIVPNDSAGQPLALTAPGRLIRHVTAAFGRRVGSEVLLILLKHPLTAAGLDRGTHLRLTRDLELHLRRHGPAFPEAAALAAWAARRDTEAREPWAAWLGQVCVALNQPPEAAPLAEWTRRLEAALALIAEGPTPGGNALWDKAAGQAARAIVDGLVAEADAGGDVAAPDFADLVAGLMAGVSVPPGAAADQRVQILGTQEARALDADMVILGGLTEGTWPAAPAPDPWLSRPMRVQAGLLLPERRIGLQAHDFQQAVNAPQVVLSYARRDDEAETVPSRWLARIVNLLAGLPTIGGPQVLEAARDRGQVWLDWAARLDLPRDDLPEAARRPAPRPSPQPPRDARPRELPVTDIARLLRDPYAVYARRILRLRPLDPLRATPDAALRGTALHDVVEGFIANRPPVETPDAARARLLAVAEHVLTQTVPWPAQRRFWLARIAGFATAFVAAEQGRAATIAASHLEAGAQGRMVLPRNDFTLTAKPDRIDLLTDGRVAIYDYKSGAPPSKTQARRYDRQLLLEAVMARDGAFPVLDGPRDVADLRYIRLGGDGAEVVLDCDSGTLDTMADKLAQLIAAYDDPAKGYTARRAMMKEADPSDYDQLSRHGEWSLADDPVAEPVGGEGA